MSRSTSRTSPVTLDNIQKCLVNIATLNVFQICKCSVYTCVQWELTKFKLQNPEY